MCGFEKRLLRALLGGLLGGSLLLSAKPAMASQDYSAEVESQLGVPCAVACSLCHRDQSGAPRTVSLADGGKPFGDALMRLGGLKGSNLESLYQALVTLQKAQTDSDGDGVSDIAELRQGTNPNVSGAASMCGPTYGCGARVAPSRPARKEALGVLFLACLVIGLLRAGRLAAAPRHQRPLADRSARAQPNTLEV